MPSVPRYTGSGASLVSTLVRAARPTVAYSCTPITPVTLSPTVTAVSTSYACALTLCGGFQWDGGDSLQVSASGGTVPAFSGSVTAARPLAQLTPTAPTTISRLTDLNVSWTPSNSTVVLLGMVGKEGAIACGALDATGQMTVPSALLQNFDAGETGVIYSIQRMNVAITPVGTDGVLLQSIAAPTPSSVTMSP